MPGKISFVMLIGALIFIIVVAFIKGLILSKHKFRCCMCNKEFYPKWYQVMYELHYFEYFKIRCPHCGKKEYHRSID